MKHLKIRWALFAEEDEPTTRQRGIFVYRQLQKMGYDADRWDGEESADIIVCQYDLRHQEAALATGATVVQDINDMIFAPHHPRSQSCLENIGKAHAVVAGTDRLAQHLRRLHPFVRVVYEAVDERYFAIKKKRHDGIEIFYHGMHDNIMYFSEIDSTLEALAHKHDFIVHFVLPPQDGQKRSNSEKVDAKPYPTKFHAWTMDTLLKRMELADIAVVPLYNDEWSACKASNKALCSMAIGIPVATSDVIPYQAVINNGDNGFLCTHPEGWERSLGQLLTDSRLRDRMGAAGKLTATKFSIQKIAEQWIAFFEEIKPR